MPENDVYARFLDVRAKYSVDDASSEMISYFGKTYIGYDWKAVRYPISFWNVYDRFLDNVPRTTNEVEGWHYKMNNKLTSSNVNLITSLSKIREEQSYWENQIPRVRAGLGESKAKRYLKINERIGKILSNYNTTLDIFEFLEAIAACIYKYVDM